jgi:hypothetical protein
MGKSVSGPFIPAFRRCLPNRCLTNGFSGLLSRKRVLSSRRLAMDYYGFQASCQHDERHILCSSPNIWMEENVSTFCRFHKIIKIYINYNFSAYYMGVSEQRRATEKNVWTEIAGWCSGNRLDLYSEVIRFERRLDYLLL